MAHPGYAGRRALTILEVLKRPALSLRLSALGRVSNGMLNSTENAEHAEAAESFS